MTLHVMMQRPRVKPEHAPYRISGSRIRIGGISYGIAAEIAHPTGSVWAVLDSMDGTRSIDEVVGEVIRLHPGNTPESVRLVVSQLTESGYVEDAGGPDPAELSERDKQRYDRARGYYRWLDLTARASSWEPQARLRAASVTIVGIGGTGGVAALALAAAGVGRLHCVDPDVVELSNLSRQVIYTEHDIGLPKADAAVMRLRWLNSDITVSGEQAHIGSADDLVPLARDCDVLLLSADQPPELRVWANRACIAVGRSWVDAGYHGPLVQIGAFKPGTGGCWECLRERSRDQTLAFGTNPSDAAARRGAVAHAVGAVPAGISGYLAANQVIAFLSDVPFTYAEPPKPDCPACGALR